MNHIEEELEKRKNVYERYINNLKNIKGIKLNKIKENTDFNYAYFPIMIGDDYYLSRDELFSKLQENNIYCRKYFYPIVTECLCYKEMYDSSLTPIAKDLSERVITLPMYADLDLDIVDKICDIIKSN